MDTNKKEGLLEKLEETSGVLARLAQKGSTWDEKVKITKDFLSGLFSDNGGEVTVRVQTPELDPNANNMAGIEYGGATNQSPHHSNEDRFIGKKVYNHRTGVLEILRVVVADGSGGSMDELNIPEADKVKKIQQRAEQIVLGVTEREAMRLSSAEAINKVNEKARVDGNQAYATVAVFDVTKDMVSIGYRGDVGVVSWIGGEDFDHRRNPEGFKGWNNLGGPSKFQLLIQPQNTAQALKAGGLGDKTHTLDDAPGSNSIFAFVGPGLSGGPELTRQVELPRNSKDTWYLVASDGVRYNSLLDPNTDYSRKVNGIMKGLQTGRINEVEAAKRITHYARATGDTDDGTVVVIKVPGLKMK